MTKVSPEQVVAVLLRTEHGAAMWRAATYEALSEAQAERIAELEKRHAVTVEPAGPDSGVGPADFDG